MTHELKIMPEYFEPVLMRTKTFEIRKNDRGYKVGDIYHRIPAEAWLCSYGD